MQVVVQQARTERRAADKILLSELLFFGQEGHTKITFYWIYSYLNAKECVCLTALWSMDETTLNENECQIERESSFQTLETFENILGATCNLLNILIAFHVIYPVYLIFLELYKTLQNLKSCTQLRLKCYHHETLIILYIE